MMNIKNENEYLVINTKNENEYLFGLIEDSLSRLTYNGGLDLDDIKEILDIHTRIEELFIKIK